jgi:hypothetical protein
MEKSEDSLSGKIVLRPGVGAEKRLAAFTFPPYMVKG